jgi:hypothetical protein
VNPAREDSPEQGLSGATRQSIRRFAVYGSGTLLALVAAGLAMLLVDSTPGKLVVWAATLVLVSLLWGAGAALLSEAASRRRESHRGAAHVSSESTADSPGSAGQARAGQGTSTEGGRPSGSSRRRALRARFPTR